MYKLSVYIYLNHVPFDARQKSYEFKSLVNFGTSKKNSKSPQVGRFYENHAKSNFSNFETEIGLFRHFFSDLRICFFLCRYIFHGIF